MTAKIMKFQQRDNKKRAVNPCPGMAYYVDALKGDGDTFEEKVSLSDEMRLHAEKHKPEGI